MSALATTPVQLCPLGSASGPQNNLRLYSGNTNRPLAEAVATHLTRLFGAPIPVTPIIVGRFADGEVRVEIAETVRGKDVFLVQTLGRGGGNDVNQSIMELLVMIDAFKRASPRRVSAVIPYYGYARQDRKSNPRTPISARLVASLLETAGADRVIVIDLHAGQIQGFFDRCAVDHLSAFRTLYSAALDFLKPLNILVAAPDVGGVPRARSVASRFGSDLVIVDKRRPRPNQVEVVNIIGCCKDRNVLLVDDMIDTAGTLVQGAAALRAAGAARVFVFAAHAVFSGDALDRLEKSVIERVWVTDTIPPVERECAKITRVSVGELLAEAIRAVHIETSLSAVFE